MGLIFCANSGTIILGMDSLLVRYIPVFSVLELWKVKNINFRS